MYLDLCRRPQKARDTHSKVKKKYGKTVQYKNVKDKELVTKKVKKKQKTKQN